MDDTKYDPAEDYYELCTCYDCTTERLRREAVQFSQQDPMFKPRNVPSFETTEPAATGEHPDNNPKTRVGALKAPLHLVPPSAEIALAEALADGASKYGAYNWREERISMTVYIGAIKRHLGAFIDGEDLADDSGVDHLAHIMACAALMIDARSIGMLNDDRPTRGAAPVLLEQYKEKQEAKREGYT